jgi:hypothetical protein
VDAPQGQINDSLQQSIIDASSCSQNWVSRGIGSGARFVDREDRADPSSTERYRCNAGMMRVQAIQTQHNGVDQGEHYLGDGVVAVTRWYVIWRATQSRIAAVGENS